MKQENTKRMILILLIVCISVFSVACNAQTNSQEKSDTSDTEYIAKNADRTVNAYDFENAYSMCKAFLENYYDAAMCGGPLNIEQFVENKNFQQYIQLKLKYGKQTVSDDPINISYGLNAVEWNEKKEYGFLNLTTKVDKGDSSFSESHQFILCDQTGSLTIADWYSKGLGTPSSLDDTVRGDMEKIKNPKLWEDSKNAAKWIKKAESVI